MGDLVNLNRARKAKRRKDAAATAEANRAAFGRTRAKKQADAGEQARRDALLDGALLDD